MMVSELATAIPEEGGFYIWVRRGMGRFMGYQETWLTLAGSVFEMALYPESVRGLHRTVCAEPRRRATAGWQSGFAMIAVCTAWNIFGAQRGGRRLGGAQRGAARAVRAADRLRHVARRTRTPRPAPIPLRHADFLGGILIAMWNYMGWDNLSTIAGEVESPQRTYTRAMLGAVVLVVVGYLLPRRGRGATGIDPNSLDDRRLGGRRRDRRRRALALAVTIAGVIGAVGSFGALMLSFTRLPVVMAEDGYLPKVFTQAASRSGAPWVAVIACALFWAHLLPAGIRAQPDSRRAAHRPEHSAGILGAGRAANSRARLARPYRVPGGTIGAILIGLAAAGTDDHGAGAQ